MPTISGKDKFLTGTYGSDEEVSLDGGHGPKKQSSQSSLLSDDYVFSDNDGTSRHSRSIRASIYLSDSDEEEKKLSKPKTYKATERNSTLEALLSPAANKKKLKLKTRPYPLATLILGS